MLCAARWSTRALRRTVLPSPLIRTQSLALPLLLVPLLASVAGSSPAPTVAAASPAVVSVPLATVPSHPFVTFASKRPPRSRAPVSRATLSDLSSSPEPDLTMAWRCSGNTNAELVDNLANGHVIKTQRVRDAMHAVDRGLFLYQGVASETAYEDSPQLIGYGATISAPHMHAMALELLADYLKPNSRALDVGSGSGYLLAAMAVLAGANKPSKQAQANEDAKSPEPAAAASSSNTAHTSTGPSIYGIEHIEELVEASKANLARWDPNYASYIYVTKGDGRKGVPGQQFDAIHVGAAADKTPQALIDQLRAPGRLVIPVGTHTQYLVLYDKAPDGTVTHRRVTGVQYVPLTDEEKQLENQRWRT